MRGKERKLTPGGASGMKEGEPRPLELGWESAYLAGDPCVF